MDADQQIGYLRAKAIDSLVNQAAVVFADHANAILAGTFDRPLCELIPSSTKLHQIQVLSRQSIYCWPPVVKIETAGFEIISGLLGAFLEAIFDKRSLPRSQSLLKLLPRQYLDLGAQPFDNPYLATLGVCEFIASMTDNYAISTYRAIKGIELSPC